jgi:hypothetical protein
MRILSARITRARRDRSFGEVEAMVTLIVLPSEEAGIERVDVAVSSPARAPGAAPLRDRLLAQAKLGYATGRIGRRARQAA